MTNNGKKIQNEVLVQAYSIHHQTAIVTVQCKRENLFFQESRVTV